MPIVPIYLNIDDKTYEGVKSGALELYGLAKNVDNKRIAKHIPTITDAAKEGASKAIDFVRLHQKETFIISGVLVVGGTVAGTVLDNLINSIEAIEKNNPKKSINLNISAAQFSDLINCIFDFTRRLAEANNISTRSINRPKYFHKKTSADLKYYLNMQKQIFEQAA